jgi:hypothetical protein
VNPLVWEVRLQGVWKQLRHSDAKTTLGIYGHVIGDQQRTVVESFRKTREFVFRKDESENRQDSWVDAGHDRWRT